MRPFFPQCVLDLASASDQSFLVIAFAVFLLILFVKFIFMLSLERCVDVPLILFCPADHVCTVITYYVRLPILLVVS